MKGITTKSLQVPMNVVALYKKNHRKASNNYNPGKLQVKSIFSKSQGQLWVGIGLHTWVFH